MMKVMRKIFCFFVIGAMVFASCGKKTSEKEEKKASDLKTVSVKLNEDAPLYMLSNMTVSGFSINDTTNGIKAKVLMPIKKQPGDANVKFKLLPNSCAFVKSF